MDTTTKPEWHAVPWNKGKLLGQKPPFEAERRSGASGSDCN
jgi:hypothetical protein